VIGNVFQDAFNYMKNGTLIRQVLNKINEIDFNRSEDREVTLVANVDGCREFTEFSLVSSVGLAEGVTWPA
jgi:hypothetical protein